MTTLKPFAPHPTSIPTDVLVRVGRRSLVFLLVMVVYLSGTFLVQTLWPGSVASRAAEKLPMLLPIAIVLFFGFARRPLQGRPFDPRSPEVKAFINDELRQQSLGRATKLAFITVMTAQPLLALLFLLAHEDGRLLQLSMTRALLAMAVSTVTLGMVTLLTLFLHFDRE